MKSIQIVNVLSEFAEFCRGADRSEFLAVFGERIGSHLWSKLVDDYQRDFGNLLCAMDGHNILLLAKHLKKKGKL